MAALNVAFRHLLSIGLLIVVLACLALSLAARDPVLGNLIGADALYLPVLFSDVLSNGGRVSDWYLPPAPYFFPDYLSFLFAYLVTKNIFAQAVIFPVIQCAVTFGLLWLLASQALRNARSETLLSFAALTTALLVWLALYDAEPFLYMFVSAYHYGGFISSLLFVSLWIMYERRTSNALLAAISLLSWMSSLSDNLFVVCPCGKTAKSMASAKPYR